MSLFGFYSKNERKMFLQLIEISGVGPKLAITVLSGMSVESLAAAVAKGDVKLLSKIKGVGKKTAERIILELKDKIVKGGETDMSALFAKTDNKAAEEATTALIMLGFTKANVTKAVNAVLKETPSASIEVIIKKALQKLS